MEAWDYTKPGAYFVTLCTQGRACLFGDVHDGEMRLNALGNIVAGEWVKTREVRHEIERDEWVVMPNHFHGILAIVESRRGRPPGRHCDTGHSRRPATSIHWRDDRRIQIRHPQTHQRAAWNTVNACVATDLPRAGPPQ